MRSPLGTLKIHILIEHLEQCLNFLDEESGLGYWSEQSGESIHHEFSIYWQRYKINEMNDESYPKRLKKAVIECSSLHL